MIIFLIILTILVSVFAEAAACFVERGGGNIDFEYGLMSCISFSIVTIQVFILTPYRNMLWKSLSFIQCSWAVFNCVVCSGINPYAYCYVPLIFAQSTSFGVMFLYMLFKSYELPSDTYTNDAVYIVCKKPQNMLDFMFSFIAKPMSSISVVSSGIWFGYTFGKNYYQEPYVENECDCFLKLNVSHTFVLRRLETILGAKWSPFNNCCHAVMRLYPSIKISIFNILPCFFIKQLLGYENDRQNNR